MTKSTGLPPVRWTRFTDVGTSRVEWATAEAGQHASVTVEPPVIQERTRTAPTLTAISAAGSPALPRRLPAALRRSSWPKMALLSTDAFAIAIGLWLTYVLRAQWPHADGNAADHARLAALSLPLWLLTLTRYRLYASRHVQRPAEELNRLLHAGAAGAALMALLGQALGMDNISRGWLLMAFPFTTATLATERLLARKAFGTLRGKGRMLRRVIMVGTDSQALKLSTLLLKQPELGYEIVGFLDDRLPAGTVVVGNRKVLGRVEDTYTIVGRTTVDGIIISATAVDTARANSLCRRLTDAGFHVELTSSLSGTAVERMKVRPLTPRFSVLYVEPIRRSGLPALTKRVFDVVAAAGGLVLLAPTLVILAVLVRLDSPGPVLFTQVRIGRDGKPFRLLKLRSMVRDAEQRLDELRAINEADGPLFKLRADPRVTRVGRFIRATSLDELPQLWNVLRGDMSLVGPRPALPSEVAGWTPELYERLRVRPGITGMWQINGRSESSFEDYKDFDLYYVDNWSLPLDLAILVKTVPTVLSRRGAQ